MDKSIDSVLDKIQSEMTSIALGIPRDQIPPDLEIEKDLVVAIQGVRRCGKSTLLHQIAKTKGIRSRSIFVNFEDPRLADQLDHTILDKIVEFHESRSKKNTYYFFDEIQNVKNWERWLHVQMEQKRRHFVITGSNSTLLGGKLGTALTGRHLTLELFPFSYREFKKFDSKGTLQDYLRAGGFPRALTHNKPAMLLREYFTDIIERDVRRHVVARSSVALTRVAKAIFESTGSEISLRNLSRAFDTTPDSVKTYVDAFASAYLCLPCPYFTYSERKSIVRPAKYYPIDLALRSCIVTKTGLDLGKKLETAVFHALRRKYHRVYYWRGKGEVDFVVETDKGILPIQVTWDGIKDRHGNALDEFKTEHPESLAPVSIDKNNAEKFLCK